MVKATPRIPSECGAETIILRPWLESWLASCWPGCRSGPMVYIYIYMLDHTLTPETYVAKTPPEHTFLLHCASGGRTALSSNSIKQHRVPAWPAGHPMESQHGLLVVRRANSNLCAGIPPTRTRELFRSLFVLLAESLSQAISTTKNCFG